MSMFRKKPVIIEARQWDGSAGGATPIIDWILSGGTRSARYAEPQPATTVRGKIVREAVPALLKIDTLEGTMGATEGDWIIRGVQGEFYPCKPDIFEATYEPVPHTAAILAAISREATADGARGEGFAEGGVL